MVQRIRVYNVINGGKREIETAMTLGDFFTVSEMEEGLTSLSRVRELVAVMTEERNSAIKSVSQASRHWAAVSNTIAATINAACIELFLQLDGFLIISNWLNEAEIYSRDAPDEFVEESLSAILKAVEKLKIDRGKCEKAEGSSGIMNTVENLLLHGNSLVQESARKLHDQWKSSNSSVETEALENGGVADKVDEEAKSLEDRSLPNESLPDAAAAVSKENGRIDCENGDAMDSNPAEDSSCDLKSMNHPTDTDESEGSKREYGCEMDYGIVDALEVARQVAQEVERQVVDYKEPSCSSSSEKILKNGFRLPGSPESVMKPPEIKPETEDGHNSLTESQTQEDENQKPVCFPDLNEEILPDSPDRSPEQVQSAGSNRRESGLEIDLNMSLDLNLNESPARNFDLNDRPFQPTGTPESVSVPVFSLFGAKFPLSGVSKPPQITKSHHETGFSRVLEVPYPSPVFGYNSQLPLPLPLPSYITPVPLPYQQPFIMNMAAPQFPLHGVGAPRPPLDLNAGYGFDGAIRQLLVPRPLEEQYGSSSQASSSGLSGKRKEPENGWDAYAWQYKHPQPPWR